MYEKLLIALDGSATGERVLEHAEALATAFDSTVTVVRATVSAEMVINETTAGETTVGAPASILDPATIVDADRDDAVEYLDMIAARLRQHKIKVNVEHHEGAADQVIVDRASELGVGLILMTTHGRSGLGRLVFGSVADAVLRHAPCPVLLVRIRDEDSAPVSEREQIKRQSA